MWKDFKKHNPKKKGWYMCTVEVKGFQRYTMSLYWDCRTQRFTNNCIQHIFDMYKVYGYSGRLYTDELCDRTEDVVAWRKIPKAYMKGFIEQTKDWNY